MNRPYSIRIFLPGGDPDGLRTIEKSGWSGAGIVVPRALMADAKQRRELIRTGVYVLVGPPEESGLPRIYVGEGDPIKPRLEQHAAKKDFWTTCIAFTSKDENLNKAHVQYLEARLIELAAQAKRCLLDNGNIPALPTLSEADVADAEGFLAEILLCFPLLGVNVFSPMAASARHGTRLSLSGRGAKADGAETPEGFVVLVSSTAAADEVASCPGSVREMRKALLANGVLKLEVGKHIFTQDYVFTSPSTAASVVLGRSANGREEWKTKDGKTLKALQEGTA
ncbi:MAG: GIY-YIG nuclease family protein [Planctomycetota bacterium]